MLTHEEKQIHNAVHAELREFEEFKNLVKRMRDAQVAFQKAIASEDINEMDYYSIVVMDAEREVDEYLKKMEV